MNASTQRQSYPGGDAAKMMLAAQVQAHSAEDEKAASVSESIRKAQPVEGALLRLADAVARAERACHALEQRIAPVLIPLPPQGQRPEFAPDETMSPLHGAIESQTYRLHLLVEYLQVLVENVTV